MSFSRHLHRDVANRSADRAALAAAVRPCLETLENRLLMDGEFGSLVTRGALGADTANAAAYDRDGNGIVAGSFSGAVDFAPGSATMMLDSTAGSGYVAKYDTAGNAIWARRLGGGVTDVAVDKNNNVYVTGSFNGTRDFDSTAGTTNLTSAGWEDVFVAKFNGSGALQWARRVGGATYSDFGTGVGVDNKGNVYVTGSFAGTVDFNPGAGVANRSATLTDGFVLKLNSSGSYSRVSQLAGAGSAYVNDLAVDGAGNVFATGRFDKSSDFNPGSGATLMFSDNSLGGNYDGFVWKIKTDGTLGYAKRFGGGLWDEGNGIAIDAVGNAYVTGKFTYSAWFNAGSGGTLNAYDNSGSDGFVAKYDSEGAFKWTKKLGGGENDEAGLDIAIDGGRNVYVTGYFRGIANLNPNGWGLVGSSGGTDAFVTVLSTNGDYFHSERVGGTGNDQGRAIAVDAARGNYWVAGSFTNTVDFDPKAGVQNRTSAGSTDAFLLRLKRTASPLDWVTTSGFGVSEDEGHFVETDSNGNVYVAGIIRGVADLDTSAGYEGHGPIGSGGDVFVSKYAPDGSYLWSRVATHRESDWQLGDEKIGGLAVDASGNVVIVGTFLTTGTRTLDFPNTTNDLQSTDGRTDGFIWKLNTDGGHVFATKFGQENTETADGVAVDASGNIYVTGTFDYEVQWGPGVYDYIQSSNYSVGDYSSDDVWVAKYSSSGAIQWAKNSGSGEDDRPTAIAVDSINGYVHVVGTFEGDRFRANHMSNYGAYVDRTGTLDSFVVRYATANGYASAVNRLGGTGATRATAVDVDTNGNVWIGGDFTLTTDLNPSAGVASRTSAGGTDAFAVKLGSSGNYLFGTKIGGASADTVTGLDVAAGNNVYLTGTFRNNIDFNPSATLAANLNGGSESSFSWRLSDTGVFRAAHKFSGRAADIAVSADGSAHVVGSITAYTGADMDPGAATSFPLTASSSDIFTLKFQPGTTPSTFQLAYAIDNKVLIGNAAFTPILPRLG